MLILHSSCPYSERSNINLAASNFNFLNQVAQETHVEIRNITAKCPHYARLIHITRNYRNA